MNSGAPESALSEVGGFAPHLFALTWEVNLLSRSVGTGFLS